MSASTPDRPPRAPNRLAGERSPYLLQHQWNPVDWHPWGEEAFEKARREDKAVFLSIGYSSCHWCHVMERESFESETIAGLLNRDFVSIKVDREERPDVDEIYMTAVQLLTGSGGWPMSVFLTPEQKPFWGGTYFPPDDRGGRPGFATIVAELAQAYRSRRAEVLDAADRLTTAVGQMGTGRRFVAPGPLGPELLGNALAELLQVYDRRHGGFGTAPKFPPHGALRLLLHALAAGRTPAGEARDALAQAARGTLDAMALGGIRDHVGGGFHRYATDPIWLVPHFEKMLYDNAQLLASYAEAFAIWEEPEHRRVAEEIAAWALREMAGEEGGFFSAIDADSEGGEGAYYLWSRSEVLETLGEEDGERFARVYGIEEEGNFTDPVTGEAPGNIPHLTRSWEEAAREEGMSVEALRDRMDRARVVLRERRERRAAPGVDDKVLTAWNGLMIGALARAGSILNRADWIDAAVRTAHFVVSRMRRDGRLLRSYRAGSADLRAYLEDHAFLASGLLDLSAATQDDFWLNEAGELVDQMLDRFWDAEEGGFFFVADDHEALIARSKEVFDQAVPSANGMAAQVLVRIHAETGEARYAERVEATLHALAGVLYNAPRASESLMLALAMWFEVRGVPEAGETETSAPQTAAQEAGVPEVGDAAGASGARGPLARSQRGPVLASAHAPRTTLRRGERIPIELRLEIEPGWHIGSVKSARKDRAATSVEVGAAEGLRPGEMRAPDGAPLTVGGETLTVYAGAVAIRFPLEAEAGALPGRAPVVIRVRHQACDDRRCLAPDQLELSFAVEILG